MSPIRARQLLSADMSNVFLNMHTSNERVSLPRGILVPGMAVDLCCVWNAP